MVYGMNTDLSWVDGLANVTHTPKGGTPQSSIPALRRAISQREAAKSGGEYRAGDVRFHVQASLDDDPVAGGTITDADGTVWTIQSKMDATMDTRVAINCRNLVISESLTNVIEVQEATFAKGSYGEQVPTWATASGLGAVPAKIQILSGDSQIDSDRQSTKPAYACYCLTSFEPKVNQRVIDSSGAKYRILSWSEVESISGLLEIILEEMTTDS